MRRLNFSPEAQTVFALKNTCDTSTAQNHRKRMEQLGRSRGSVRHQLDGSVFHRLWLADGPIAFCFPFFAAFLFLATKRLCNCM